MSNYKTARMLREGALVNIITNIKNASNQNKDFYGEFVRLDEKGSNYSVTIRRRTDYTNISNKPVYEELCLAGHNISKINKY